MKRRKISISLLEKIKRILKKGGIENFNLFYNLDGYLNFIDENGRDFFKEMNADDILYFTEDEVKTWK